jgi:hypothetical protein
MLRAVTTTPESNYYTLLLCSTRSILTSLHFGVALSLSFLEPIFRLRNQSTLQMLQSYDHSGEETSRKRGIDQQDDSNDDTATANGTEGKGTKIMRQNHNDTEQNEGTETEKNGDGDDEEDDNVVDPPARERPAVSVCDGRERDEMNLAVGCHFLY